MPAPTSENVAARSSTCGLAPAWPQAKAAASPPIPPPTMIIEFSTSLILQRSDCTNSAAHQKSPKDRNLLGLSKRLKAQF
jgi:hypothetical protein